MKKNLTLTVLALFATGILSMDAATLFWDANGTAGCGGLGNWGGGAVQGNFWGTACDTGLTTWNSATPDSAVFSANSTPTVTNAITVNKITVSFSVNILGSSTMTFAGTDAGADVGNGLTLTLTAPYTGSLFTKTGAGRLELSNATAGPGITRWKINQGFISFPTAARVNTPPATLVPDYLTIDSAGLASSLLGTDLTATRGITIGAGGASFG